MSGDKSKPIKAETPIKGSKFLKSETKAVLTPSNKVSVIKHTEDEFQIPTLQFAGSERISSNFYQFAEALHTACSINYGSIARLIKINDWPSVPLPIKPHPEDVEYDDDEYEQLVEDWKESRKLAIRENIKIRSYAPQMFSKIMMHLSEESKAAVKESVDWEDIEINEDPVRLWNRVRETHLATSSANTELDKLRARNLYAKLYQSKNEPLVKFKERTLNALKVLKAVNETVPSDQAVAMDFISRLDNSKFADLKKTLENNVILNTGKYPKTLNEAYTIANNIKVIASSSGGLKIAEVAEQNVFLTSAARLRETHENRNKTNQSKNKTSKRANQRKKREPGPCFLCNNGSKHWARGPECLHKKPKPFDDKSKSTSSDKDAGVKESRPERDVPEQQHLTTDNYEVIFTSVKLPKVSSLDSFDVLLDNQCTSNLFHNSKMLKNIRLAGSQKTFTGLGGSLIVTEVGDSPWFGRVYYHQDAPANVLSFSEMAKAFSIEWVQDRNMFVVVGGEEDFKLEFQLRDGLYVCNLREKLTYSFVTTTLENEKKFTKREVFKAREAKELSQLLAYPSPDDLVKLIRNGGIINCPVTAHDVARAIQIYGPDIGSLKGKTKRSKPEIAKIEYVKREVSALQTLHVDVMFVEGDTYLVSVSKPLGLTQVNHVNTRSLSHIRPALLAQINSYMSNKFVISTLLTDSEGAVKAMKSELNAMGIEVNSAGAGQHVPVIENKIRQIKERIRAVLNTLPFTLPASMLKNLVFYSVKCLNMMPCRTRMDMVSPREAFTGRKIDYRLDLRAAFGDYIQAHLPNVSEQDVKSLNPRTSGALVVSMTGNLQGSVQAIDLNTMKMITRDKFTILPMPPTVIDYLNRMAAEQKRKLSRDPIFRIGNEKTINSQEDDNGITTGHETYHDLVSNDVVDPLSTATGYNDINYNTDIAENTFSEVEGPTTTLDPVISSKKEKIDFIAQPESEDLMKDFDADATTEQNDLTPFPATDYHKASNEDYGIMPRYSLRKVRSSWRNGPWQYNERPHETGLHISAGAAVEKFGAIAIDVMKKD
jgi:hypothetical protein